MRLPPILATLTRHKLIVLLMIITTALTSAVITNMAVMIVDRVALLNSPTGIEESELVSVDVSDISGIQNDTPAMQHERFTQYQVTVAALRNIHGVVGASAISGLPFEGGAGLDIASGPDVPESSQFQATAFIGGSGMLNTLGLHLIQGRNFLDSEYLPSNNMENLSKVSSAIVSRALAVRLFHTNEAVGSLFYQSGHPIRVVGVVDHLMGMNPELGSTDSEFTMLLPLQPDGTDVTFALRTDPQDRDRVLRSVVAALGSSNRAWVLDNAKLFSQVRLEYFQRESSMISLLLTAGLILLGVTLAGLMGLVSFWVQQRDRSTGIRRALGARRIDVVIYYLTENFVIAAAGVMLGCLLAYALNLFLLEHYGVRVLPFDYLIVGALVLWITVQAAGLFPALRAALVPPVVATRSI